MILVFTMPRTNVRRRRRVTRKRRPLTVKTVKRIARKEASRAEETKVKTIDYSTMGMNSVSNSGNTYFLANAISQGTTSDTRVGDQIFFRGFKFFFPLQPGDNTNYFRLAFVMPKRDYGYGGSVSELLDDIFEGSTQWYNPINTQRYNVLYDKTYSMYKRPLDGSTATSLTDVTKILKGFVKVNKKIQWEYAAYANAKGPMTDVIAVMISDSAAISHPGAVGGFVKLWYKDA